MRASWALGLSGWDWLPRTPWTSCGICSATAWGRERAVSKHNTQMGSAAPTVRTTSNHFKVQKIALQCISKIFHFHTGLELIPNSSTSMLLQYNSSCERSFLRLRTSHMKWVDWAAAAAARLYLAALDQLLVSRLVLVGGGGVLSCSDGLSGRSCCLLGCILHTNTCIGSKRFTGNWWKTHFSQTHSALSWLARPMTFMQPL